MYENSKLRIVGLVLHFRYIQYCPTGPITNELLCIFAKGLTKAW